MNKWWLFALIPMATGCGPSAEEVAAQRAAEVAAQRAAELEALKAARQECANNVLAIKKAEMAYDAEYNTFVTAVAHPSTTPNKSPRDWGNGNTDFQKLGWHPDGKVRGTYSVATTAAGSSTPGGNFTVKGSCDVDADGTSAVYTATKSINTVFLNTNDTY